MFLQGLLITFKIRLDDVRHHNILQVLSEFFQAEGIVQILHLSNRSCDLGLSKDSVEERVLKDAVQKGHISQSGSKSVPRRSASVGHHQSRLSFVHCLCLAGRGCRIRICLGLGLSLFFLRLSRRHGVATLLPLLRLFGLLMIISQIVDGSGRSIHDSGEFLPRLVEKTRRGRRRGIAGGLQDLPGLLERLVLFRDSIQSAGGGAGDVPRFVFPTAQQLRGLRRQTLHPVSKLFHLFRTSSAFFSHAVGRLLNLLPILSQLIVSFHIFLHLVHHLLDEAVPSMLLCQPQRRRP
mmetsp:Transcript_13662/g.30189  ORF Transcript_13662/g.30189 Transcript_13662/m.30189 type:complete len:293 (+) Transcript_13662:484-1362(+)